MKVPRLQLGLGEAHAEAISAVLGSGLLVQGEQVEAFESALATRCGRKHAIAVSSGTSALELALRVLDVGPGDEVLCPALTWPSPAHAVITSGAKLRLVDVDPETWNAGPEAFALARGPHTKVAIAIDQFGAPADHDAILRALPGVTVIEDAACALGSTYRSRPCGSFGAISCLSFHPLKVLTTAEGGMCLTDDDALASRLRALRNHGQSKPGHFLEASGNARLSEIHAALGNVHLTTLDARVSRRQQVRRAVEERAPVRVQRLLEGCTTNAQTLGVLFDSVQTPDERAAVMAKLRAREVGVGPLSYALTTIGSIQGADACPNAEFVAAVGIAIPCDASLSDEQVDYLIEQLAEVA